MSEPLSNPESDLALLASFVEEAREHMQAFSDGLLQLEGGGCPSEVINGVFRAIHTIKGCARTLGCIDIGKVSHSGENVLDAMRKQTVVAAPQVMEVLFQTCDLLNVLLSEVERHEPQGQHDAEITPLLARLGALLAVPAAAAEPVVDWPAPGCHLSSQLVGEFAGESADHIAAMEAALLEFEKNPLDLTPVNSVFRAIHSIKGTADYVGLSQIKFFTHHFESVLDLLRKGSIGITPAVSDLVFQAADALRLIIRNLGPDSEADTDLKPLVIRLNRLVGQTHKHPLAPSASAPQAESDPRLAVFIRSADQQVESIDSCLRKLTAKDCTHEVVSALHRACTTLISAAEYMERDEFLAPAQQIVEIADLFRADKIEFDALFLGAIADQATALRSALEGAREDAGALPPDRIGDVLCARAIAERNDVEAALQLPVRAGDRLVAQGVATRDEVETAAAIQAGSMVENRGAVAARTMRVDQGKLDSYLNLAGELIVARNELAHAFRLLTTDRATTVRALKDAVDSVARVARDIQDNAMGMRMVPVRNVFQRFPRMIRDIAKAQGKTLTLQTFGEDTELDKQVAEALGDPLVHLIRNAADHGIESPADRIAAGKSETGTVELRAAREGNCIVIGVIDDGAGINVNRLKAKAVESGVITATHAENMPRAEALQLIFAPGLSTAKVVSDISGRGVGMDVVKNNIAAFGGSVTISSQEGQGSQIQIRLPLTLAVTTVVLIGCAGETFALPMEAVVESVKVAPEDITRLKGNYLISLRGSVVGVLPLARLLALQRGAPGGAAAMAESDWILDECGRISVVIVTVQGLRYGLIVDQFKGQQEIVVKPLPGFFAHLPGLGGATIMGEGTIVLVLDPTRLIHVGGGKLTATGENSSWAA